MIRTMTGMAQQGLRAIVRMRPLPRLLTWTVTFRCNARCSMCDSWRKDASDELDTDTALGMVRSLPRSLTAVRLTGGEPFVRADFGRLVRGLEDHLKPEFVHITTNGFLTSSILAFLEERSSRRAPALKILVSLDGMKDSHDRIRGRPRSFERAIATVRALAGMRRATGLDLAVNQTVVDQTGIEEYGELHALLRRLDVPHHVVVAYAQSATYSTTPGVDLAPRHPGEFKTVVPLERSIVERFLDTLEADLAELPLANRLAKAYYYRGLRSRLIEGRSSPNPPCVALSSHLRVFPDGMVPVCQFNSKPVGNIARDGFDAVWNGERIRSERDWVRACPGCWAECEVLPSALLGGDLFRKTSMAEVFKPKRVPGAELSFLSRGPG